MAHLMQIMKSDEDVRMISAEAPVLFAKVCPAHCQMWLLRNVGLQVMLLPALPLDDARV